MMLSWFSQIALCQGHVHGWSASPGNIQPARAALVEL